MIENQVPLVWTSLGNLPAHDLEVRPSWELHQTDGNFDGMTFVEETYHKGALVKRAVHVYRHKGVAAEGQAGGLA